MTKFELIRAFDPDRSAVINTRTEKIEKFFLGDDRIREASIYRDQLNAVQAEVMALPDVQNVSIDQGAVWTKASATADWMLHASVDEAIAALSPEWAAAIAAANA